MRRITLAFVAIALALAFGCESKVPVDIESLVSDAEFSGGGIVLPEIKLDSEDAEKANAEIKKLGESWREWTTEGIKITSSYDTALRDGVLSVRVTEVFDDGITSDSRYYTYLFEVDSGRQIEYAEFLGLFGISADEAEFYMKQAIAQSALRWSDESFMPYQTLRGAMSQTLRNYTDAAESGFLSFYFDESGTPFASVMFITPEGSIEQPVALVPSAEASALLRGDWLLDTGDTVHRLSFDGRGRLTVTETDAEGNVNESFEASYEAQSEGTGLQLRFTTDESSFEVRLTGTFMYQFIALPDEQVPIAAGEYAYDEPELQIGNYYEIY